MKRILVKEGRGSFLIKSVLLQQPPKNVWV